MPYAFNTLAGQTVARELMVSYLNTGTHEAPVWSAIGKRVEDSSIEHDWSEETIRDILGSSYTTAKKPTKSQSFDGMPLDAGDAAAVKIHEIAIIKEDVQAMTSQDMLIAHWYLSNEDEVVGHFAERYDACMVKPDSIGGDGGGNLVMPTTVTYGGERTLGTVTKGTGGAVTFTPATAA